MMVEVIRSSTAERDFVALVDYFAAIDDALARRFMYAVDENQRTETSVLLLHIIDGRRDIEAILGGFES